VLVNGDVLGGLRIVEVSAFIAAPLGGMTLAQLGADVIRIDPPSGGLDYHRWPVTESNVSLFWSGLNKSKRSVAIDFTTDAGRELAMALICAPGKDAGMLLTNFPPRGWLSFDALVRHRSDLIQLTIQGDRSGGSAVDYTVNSLLGIPLLTGPKDRAEPVNHVLPAWDLITGQMAVVGLLAAERHRTRTGSGQHIKLALEDVGLAVMGHLGFIAESQLGQVRGRNGNDLYGAFGRDFECADRERVMVVGLTLKQWRSLVEATQIGEGLAHLEQSLQLDLNLEGHRFQAREEIAAVLAPWFAARELSQVKVALDSAGVSWSRYQTIAELSASDSVNPAHNPMFTYIRQPGVGAIVSPGIPLDFTGLARKPAQPAPRLGEHTDEVLSSLLGLSAGAIGRLHDQRVIASSAA
jgi:2-methylfumaryl-CoA isomerase